MSIRLYNTKHARKEEFIPIEPGKVGIYCCGPTVYNYIHLGNARPLVVFDTIRRFFIWEGWDVTYVQNFTDVDDKIINRAAAIPKVLLRNISQLILRTPKRSIL